MRLHLVRTLAILLSTLVLPGAAHAQLFRAYLASYGNDSNPCTVAAPCRLLPAALNAIVSGGEIWMLDSANFNSGAVTINKNVSILAVPGEVGSIVAVGGANAININAGLTVAMKNVSITNNTNSPGQDGIDMSTGTLSLQDSVVSVPNYAIYLGGTGSLSLHNTVIRDSYIGVYVTAGGRADISRSKFINMSYGGVYVVGSAAGVTSFAHVQDCEFAQAGYALQAYSPVVGATSRLTVHNSSVSGGIYGLVASSTTSGANAIASISGSQVSGAEFAGLYQNGTSSAVVQTLGNNQVVNNSPNTAGTITSVGGL
ncbi:MAG TPA: right-handed parallel beta-helix repeat-containing protein [Usitatibacter sp.]|nr:right-handed parallel beta-helix repeat-containing protein [Usitatibacter sp.]